MEIRFFQTPSDFRSWLLQYHAQARELWVGLYKKSTGKPSITWPESVDQALCFGWIDGIRKSVDEASYMIRFTPRKPRSRWSAINIRRVVVLTQLGLMQPAGLKAFTAREQTQPDPDSNEQKPRQLAEDFERQLRGNKAAWAWFQAQTPSYRRLSALWVMDAKKEETRLKRLAVLIESSAKGEPIPPLKRLSRVKG